MEPALPQFGARYYEKLFTIAPELRALLGSRKQQRLVVAISELVTLRSSMALPAVAAQDAVPPVRKGRGRRRIDISPDYLALMRATLLDVVREELGPDFTDEVCEAWKAAFDVLSRAMLDNLASLPTADDRFFDRHAGDVAADRAAAVPTSKAAALDEFFR